MGEGWCPPPTILTRQRGRKQDGHGVGARQAKGQGPRLVVWPRDGRTKPAPGPAIRQAPLETLCPCVHMPVSCWPLGQTCRLARVSRTQPVGLPGPPPLPRGRIPGFSQLGFSPLSVGTFTEWMAAHPRAAGPGSVSPLSEARLPLAHHRDCTPRVIFRFS